MKSKTRHVEGEGKNPRVHGRIHENMRFTTHRRFKKDIQIQTCKPKSTETVMNAKTRHVDGGGRTPLVHGEINGKNEWNTLDLRNKRRFKKDIQIQIGKPK